MKVEIGDREYEVTVAESNEEQAKGLQDIDSLPENEGMLFIFEEPQTVGFWMKDTKVPLDIIYINSDEEVISVYEGEPMNENIAEEDNVKYVLEVNQGSGIKPGDEFDMDEDGEDLPTMKVLTKEGDTQMELEGGERIFSRPNTKTLIRMSKRAERTKLDRDYKALGKKMFEYIKEQNERPAEYVKVSE